MNHEERLSELLHDPGWSLPGWPREQALARIRRAARRQRLTTACESLAVAVIAGACVLITVSAATHGTLPQWTRRPAVADPRYGPSHLVPPVGSPGFPAAIYPAAATPRGGQKDATPCPAPAGLEVPSLAIPAQALAALRTAGRRLAYQLKVSDRAIWPALADNRRRAALLPILRAAPSSASYSGPLRAGVGELAVVRQAIAGDCGDRVMRATWVIVTGVPGSPSRDAELLFLTRRGHVLLYEVQ